VCVFFLFMGEMSELVFFLKNGKADGFGVGI
jgi:hypothetical protein